MKNFIRGLDPKAAMNIGRYAMLLEKLKQQILAADSDDDDVSFEWEDKEKLTATIYRFGEGSIEVRYKYENEKWISN